MDGRGRRRFLLDDRVPCRPCSRTISRIRHGPGVRGSDALHRTSVLRVLPPRAGPSAKQADDGTEASPQGQPARPLRAASEAAAPQARRRATRKRPSARAE